MINENQENEKTNLSKNKKIAITLGIILLLLVVATSFAYYFSILKGENVNTAKTSSASIVYTEPEIGTETSQMSNSEGMKKAKPYEFTVTGNSSGTTKLDYAIYVEELEGNTVDKSQINYYLTDENDIPISLSTKKPYNGMEMIITPTGENKFYNLNSDVTIKNSSNEEIFNTTITDQNIDTYLLTYYAQNDLNLTQNGTFNIEEYDTCYQASYDSENETVTIDYDSSLESSKCTLSYETTDSSYVLKTKSTDEVKYTATMSSIYMNFDDDTKYNGNRIEYVANKLNKNNNGDSFYAKQGYTATGDEEGPVLLSSYCVKYTTSEEKGYFNEEIVDNSNCSNAYTIVIGEPEVSTIGDNDETSEYSSEGISNILTSDTFNFRNGKISTVGQYGDAYLEKRSKQSTRTYKLRYWLSGDASGTPSTEKQETTSTTNGKSHTVEFGSTGIYKFKVNVYAKQSNNNA